MINKIIFTLVLSFVFVVGSASASTTLKDIKGHWAERDIMSLVDKGLIGGYPDGTFKPNKTISRGEFSAILNRALGFQLQNGSAFSDTNGHWASNDINTLFKNSIIQSKDYSNGKYTPNGAITRLEMARMIARSLGDIEPLTTPVFKDMDGVSEEDLKYIAIAEEKRIIGGYGNGIFKPYQGATRAEASKMLNKMLQVKNEKPKPKPQEPRKESKVPSNLRMEVKNPNPTTIEELEENLNSMPLNNFTDDFKAAKIKYADVQDVFLDTEGIPAWVAGATRMKIPTDLKEVPSPNGEYFHMQSMQLKEAHIAGGALVKDGKVIDNIGSIGQGKFALGKISSGHVYEADYIAMYIQSYYAEGIGHDRNYYVMFENPFKK